MKIKKHILLLIGKTSGGDDWDDKPYQYNAEEPYNNYYKDNVRYEIKLKTLYFEFPNDSVCFPEDSGIFSVDEINNKKVPWVFVKDKAIFAGISYTDFIKQIEELGGIIYLPKKRTKE